LAFSNWFEHLGWIVAISHSTWMYPAIAALHYFSFFVTVGTIAVVDLRVLGIGARAQPASRTAEQFFPWTWGALSVAIVTGIILFGAEATAFYPSWFFRSKLLIMLVGIAFAVVMQLKVRAWDRPEGLPAAAKVTAILSLAIWLSVILTAVEVANYNSV
jgi:Family of unknown function (DUF6644)